MKGLNESGLSAMIIQMFPVQPVPDNDVEKPKMYVFTDMDDYTARGKNADKEYAAYLASRTSRMSSNTKTAGTSIKGKQIQHKSYGIGRITKFDGTTLTVNFSVGVKTLNYKICVENGYIEFI